MEILIAVAVVGYSCLVGFSLHLFRRAERKENEALRRWSGYFLALNCFLAWGTIMAGLVYFFEGAFGVASFAFIVALPLGMALFLCIWVGGWEQGRREAIWEYKAAPRKKPQPQPMAYEAADSEEETTIQELERFAERWRRFDADDQKDN